MEGHFANFNNDITWKASCVEPTIVFTTKNLKIQDQLSKLKSVDNHLTSDQHVTQAIASEMIPILKYIICDPERKCFKFVVEVHNPL